MTIPVCAPATAPALEPDESKLLDSQIVTVYTELCEMREKERESDPAIKFRPALWDLLRQRCSAEDGLNSLSVGDKKEILAGLLKARTEEEAKLATLEEDNDDDDEDDI